MQRSCLACGQTFTIEPEDLALLAKLSPVVGGVRLDLPPPTRCPECRLIRRLAFYNCRTLHRRTCDATTRPIISIYSPGKPFTVYEIPTWWSDAWDPLTYGKPFDAARSFFTQFRELLEHIPLPALAQLNDNVNSDYTNDCYKTKNSYLVFDGEQAENTFHGHTYVQLKDCMDFLSLSACELCYECIHCEGCYGIRFSRFCHNCSESWFLRDCIGCRYCFGCTNLRQKQYCIWNEQKTKEEYETFLRTFESGSHATVRIMKEQFNAFSEGNPVKALRGEQNVQCLGDNVNRSKNAQHCFDCNDQQDVRYCTDCLMSMKDSMDIHVWGDTSELMYESTVVGAQSSSTIGGYYVVIQCSNVFLLDLVHAELQELLRLHRAPAQGVLHSQYAVHQGRVRGACANNCGTDAKRR